MQGDGVFFDGETSRRHAVGIVLDGTDLIITEAGERLACWPLSSLLVLPSDPSLLRIRSAQAPELARLEIGSASFQQALRERAPGLRDKVSIDRREARRLILWTMAAAISLVGTTLLLMPLIAARLAPFVPTGLERRIGEGVFNQVRSLFGNQVCGAGNPRARAALSLLETRLRAANQLPEDAIQISVLRSKLPNALAIPGGRIVVLSAILQEAKEPDELAGILAHEMGHVAHHDGMRLLIENGGIGFIFGTVLGDFAGATAILFGARSLVAAAHSREAERDADAYAVETLRRLHRSPVPLGQFLVRLTRDMPDGGFLTSHPGSPERLAAMQMAQGPADGPPVLTDEEWSSLRAICEPAK